MVGTHYSLCFSSSRMFSLDKPSILAGSGSVVVSSGKQAPLSMQQLQQRAATIPPMVSPPSYLLHFPSSSAALARPRDWERLGHRASPRPSRHVSPDHERGKKENSNQFCHLNQEWSCFPFLPFFFFFFSQMKWWQADFPTSLWISCYFRWINLWVNNYDLFYYYCCHWIKAASESWASSLLGSQWFRVMWAVMGCTTKWHFEMMFFSHPFSEMTEPSICNDLLLVI